MNRKNLTSKDSSKFTITTTCMNREKFLLESLPTWCEFTSHDICDEIIIVDWNSREPLKDVLSELMLVDSRIKLIEVKNQKFYQHSKARNLKVQQCKNDWVLSIDCDVKIKDSNFYRNLSMVDNERFWTCPLDSLLAKGVIGTSFFHQDTYWKSGGCDERMVGWGSEDFHLHKRMMKMGYKRNNIGMNYLKHIDHPDSLRTENCEEKDKWKSNSLNNKIDFEYGFNTIINLNDIEFKVYKEN